MQVNVGQLTMINQTRVAYGLPDITLAEANDQVKHLPDETDPEFLMGWEKGTPPPSSPEEAVARMEDYRKLHAKNAAAAAAKLADQALIEADAKTKEAEAAVAEADEAKARAAAVDSEAEALAQAAADEQRAEAMSMAHADDEPPAPKKSKKSK